MNTDYFPAEHYYKVNACNPHSHNKTPIPNTCHPIASQLRLRTVAAVVRVSAQIVRHRIIIFASHILIEVSTQSDSARSVTKRVRDVLRVFYVVCVFCIVTAGFDGRVVHRSEIVTP